MADRVSNLNDLGFSAVSSTRNGSMSAWNANSIAPGNLPTPPGFLTPEQVVEQAKSSQVMTKTFSAADFLTQPTPLVDPKLGSRTFSSAPTTVPLSSPVSVSAYSNMPVPAFLTNAVNQLNQTQSLRASEQQSVRNRLLDAVLSGNYLAAEALRASVVNPGAGVNFGAAVQNPQVGQAAVVTAQAEQQKANAVSDVLSGKPSGQEVALKSQLNQVSKRLSSIPSGFAFGNERHQLSLQQMQIQRELNKLASASPKVNIVV